MNVQVSIEEVPNSEQIFELLQGGFEKFVGLLGTEITAPSGLLLKCSSVHTFGMTYPIDIAFADDHGEILKIRKQVQPKQIHSCAGAYCTFERPSVDDVPWFEVGQKVLIQEISTEERLFQDMRICYGCLLDFSGPSSLVCNLETSRNKKIANLPFIETDEYLLSEEVGEEWDKGLPPALFELDNSYSPVD